MRSRSRKINNILSLLVDHILSSLDELKSGNSGDDFILGQKYAYIECLELLQYLSAPFALRVDFDIENKYPLE